MKLVFDATGEKLFEAGVDMGVLYPLNTETALYDSGEAWNGLVSIKQKPAGASPNPSYADNLKYLNLLSLETFAGEIDAYTYPDGFAACDGTSSPFPGVVVNQQPRKYFGLAYRSKIGNDIDSLAHGFKYHLVYGALAQPAEKDYNSINDNPAAASFTWAFDCTPVAVTGLQPCSLIEIDSTKVDPTALTNLLNDLYGTDSTDPNLPLPDSVIALFSGTVVTVNLTAATFDGAHTITIPTQTGVTWYVDGVVHVGGTIVMTSGQQHFCEAVPNAGYVFALPVDTEYLFKFVS